MNFNNINIDKGVLGGKAVTVAYWNFMVLPEQNKIILGLVLNLNEKCDYEHHGFYCAL
jgi:hypothetical protein